jgi:acyl carrier protein
MIELMDSLKARYGVDFAVPPQSLDDLRTPETIAAAIQRAGGG